ncbi:hypothetical protein [Catenuloplanes japonicus]|nr:hypothetical protein [Catenuloplanes japonicus]
MDRPLTPAAGPACGGVFPLAERFEAENSPVQPIDPVVPRIGRG